ncbi:orotidine-5'-phosphate decarboxylase [Rubrobacter calidifluminis]|uniref:orotidine-5'-phosphate decarboxylase n=1 Tax=Rubrobacter calidifluminis TaxID=1392640 RepID=UPI00235FA174|nr:orotidine-5'-phosphate decarboxylase [Rubrobacter calidifluminis]
MEALIESARSRGSPLVVGLDPMPGRLPASLLARGEAEVELVGRFCLGVLESVSEEVAAVKLQAACYERLGPEGMSLYHRLIEAAADLGLPVIADVKRGDIGEVAAAYAEAHLEVYGASCVTVNPYMGEDAVVPFLEKVRELGRGGGVFVLVATSNPSASGVQSSTTPPLFEVSARLVKRLGVEQGGYPDAGAVVGATRPEVGKRVRELLPGHLFLVPGYGAQGGGVREVVPLLNERGAGVLVNSSRGVLYAYERGAEPDWRRASRAAARLAKEALLSGGVGVG